MPPLSNLYYTIYMIQNTHVNYKSYLKQFLGGPSDIDVEALKHENDDLKKKVEELQARIDELTAAAV